MPRLVRVVQTPQGRLRPSSRGILRQAHNYHKPEETPVTRAAKKSYLGQVYLDWARYPMIETEREGGSSVVYRVRSYDLRSIYPLRASVDLDKNLRVVVQRFDGRVQE